MKKIGVKKVKGVLWQSIDEFVKDKAHIYAAAMTFFALISLVPLSLIILEIVGRFANIGVWVDFISSVIHPDFANILLNVVGEFGGNVSSVIGVIFVLVVASILFNQLQISINHIWGIEPKKLRSKKKKVKRILRKRFISLIVIFALIVFLILSLVVLFIFASIAQISESQIEYLLVNHVLSLLFFFLLFWFLFAVLPDVKIDFWKLKSGAFITAVLFVVGQIFISVYLNLSSLASISGLVGFLFVFVLWVYYSFLVFFFGAELTYVLYVKKMKEKGVVR